MGINQKMEKEKQELKDYMDRDNKSLKEKLDTEKENLRINMENEAKRLMDLMNAENQNRNKTNDAMKQAFDKEKAEMEKKMKCSQSSNLMERINTENEARKQESEKIN